jgi:hypothetical protein
MTFTLLSPTTLPYGNPETAKILILGHDARLQKSDAVAQYAFFADHYFQFKKKPTYGRASFGAALANLNP